MSKISASLMCSNALCLKDDIAILSEEVDYLHLDIMDGYFVPNLGFSLDFIEELRKQTAMPFDFHLMMENPAFLIPRLMLSKKDIISIHFESSYYLQDLLNLIKDTGAMLFIAINPQTPICILDLVKDYIDGVNFLTIKPGFSGQKILQSSFDKFKALKMYLEKNHLDISVEVDGNMSFENAKKFKELGADIFVAGTSSIFPNKILNKDKIRAYSKLLKG